MSISVLLAVKILQFQRLCVISSLSCLNLMQVLPNLQAHLKFWKQQVQKNEVSLFEMILTT